MKRELGRAIRARIGAILGEEIALRGDFERRLGLAVGAVRGLALTRLFGISQRATERQWAYSRSVLAGVLPTRID
jgi:hypothetical protein